jgi:enhancing lycopene biosynthesis protein 2
MDSELWFWCGGFCGNVQDCVNSDKDNKPTRIEPASVIHAHNVRTRSVVGTKLTVNKDIKVATKVMLHSVVPVCVYIILATCISWVVLKASLHLPQPP